MGVTALMLVWCAWNQRWSPVPGSTVPLECAKVGEDGGLGSATMGAKKRSDMMDEEVAEMIAIASGGSSAKHTHLFTANDGENLSQTGYRSTVVGMILYSSVILVHAIIQYLLFALTVEYCKFFICCNCILFLFIIYEVRYYFVRADVQQEATTWSVFGSQVFFDEAQVLLAFEITWMVGFVWTFFLKFPGNIHSLFLRSECIHQCLMMRVIFDFVLRIIPRRMCS